MHIDWNDTLKRGLAFQDDDHEQAVAVMNALQTCSDEDFPALFVQLHEHTKEHLQRENDLMKRINFFAISVHIAEHDRVLAEMQFFRDKLDVGGLADVRAYTKDVVPNWFLNHLDSMDTATAMFALQMGET